MKKSFSKKGHGPAGHKGMEKMEKAMHGKNRGAGFKPYGSKKGKM
jgi:hypothetical protein